MSKNLNLLVTHIEFTARPAGAWSTDELRKEIQRRIENKFLGHKIQDLHLESACGDDVTGRLQLAPAIDVPVDAKSDLHPGTLEWAIAKMKKGHKLRRRWWPKGAYAILLKTPDDIVDTGIEYSEDFIKKVSTRTDQPVAVFVDNHDRAHLLEGSELINRVEIENWEILKEE